MQIDVFANGHGDSFDDAAGRNALRRMARAGGIHVLAAARAHELAAEAASMAHSALTWLVLKGMRGAADGDGAVSVRAARISPSQAWRGRPADRPAGDRFVQIGYSGGGVIAALLAARRHRWR